jgi:hypothetical protein
MPVANWRFGDTIITTSDYIHRWATKHLLKRAERLSNLSAPRMTR